MPRVTDYINPNKLPFDVDAIIRKISVGYEYKIYGESLNYCSSLYEIFTKIFDKLGKDGGTIRLGPGEYVLDKMVVPAPWPSDMTGTIRIIGAGMYSTVIKAGSKEAIPGYGAMFGYGYSGINPYINRVEFYDLTLDGGYGETVNETYDTSLANCGNERFFMRCRFTRSPGFTLFMAGKIVYWVIDCIFENTGQPDLSSHRDIIGGGGGCSGWVINCLYKDSAGNYLDHVNPGPVIFMFNRSTNHKIGGFYGCGVRSIVAFNILENQETGSGIGKDAGTTVIEPPNIVLFNSLKNITVNRPPATWGDIWMDEHGALHLPPPPSDHYKMFVIDEVGGIARGGAGSQISIEGGAHGVELWPANLSKLIAILRNDYVAIHSKVAKIGIPFYTDCSNIPSSGSYEGEVVICYDSTTAKYVLKVWDGSAWQTIG